jgi:hypothetical protein
VKGAGLIVGLYELFSLLIGKEPSSAVGNRLFSALMTPIVSV